MSDSVLAVVGKGSRFYVIPENATNVNQAVYCAFDAGEALWAAWIISLENDKGSRECHYSNT